MKSYILATALAVLGAATAFQPGTVRMSAGQEVSRRSFISTAAATVVVAPAVAFAADAEAPAPKVALGAVPADWGLSKDYYTDAAKIVNHMRYCTSMEKGTSNIELIANNCRKEMIDFVSYYRRFPNTAGKLSYSNLYTSINVLAGHYASYGPKFPVPEKRRKRLLQEYDAIDKAIKRQR